ncbi:MAG: hypothetical protein LQ338_005824 [Usnochroma carphineum]|nr:MAG: hypothetical protein LQ338_005824 [Usnochroma carphineum]
MAVGFGVFDAGRDAGGLVSTTQGKGEKRWVLVDMDGFEGAVCGEEVTVVVRGPRDGEDERTEVLRIEKGGGGVVGRREMREVVELAGSRWREWRDLVEGS